MKNYLDEGSAFPILPPIEGANGHGYPFPESGISAREYFCIHAIAGYAARNGIVPGEPYRSPRDLVDSGMEIADELLRRRQIQSGSNSPTSEPSPHGVDTQTPSELWMRP